MSHAHLLTAVCEHTLSYQHAHMQPAGIFFSEVLAPVSTKC